MNRETLAKLMPAIEHFNKGGNLWALNQNNEWFNQGEFKFKSENIIFNIIQDKHFDARKADVLGEDVELFDEGKWIIIDTHCITWNETYEYRPKPKYPRYFREKSSGIIVEFTDITEGIVIKGIDAPQKKTGFIWQCFTPHDRTDFWAECEAPVFEWQWYFKDNVGNFKFTTYKDYELDSNIYTRFEESKRIRNYV